MWGQELHLLGLGGEGVRGRSFLVFQPREPSFHSPYPLPPALLLAVILVHSSLGKTEPFYNPASALNAEAPFLPAFTETS